MVKIRHNLADLQQMIREREQNPPEPPPAPRRPRGRPRKQTGDVGLALDALRAIVRDPEATPAARVRAAELLLDRADVAANMFLDWPKG
jgi:hypothetical protein